MASRAVHGRSSRYVLVLLWLCVLLGSSAATAAADLDREAQWVERAAELVQAAGSRQADAVEFNRDVAEMRSELGALVRGDTAGPQALYQQMVLMVALLESAAACQSGGRIVCPVELMLQMNNQIRQLKAHLGELGVG